ncbi:hypothetical protein [Blastococcus xanthinilyticus]|uniref:Uncharacterized protein n=1 Tax=Blastococcus xanthinilyticus TaxID=1564164 RepID=A0A5S5CVN0_9ACTN|nr:hypothetical protein [Blastococcus xanthinilyticus]TYP87850.1 hypothetical protein BD833_10520 [Blastococcus xanthinilyticus]
MPGDVVVIAAPLLGCVFLLALVVVLGISSTARYEFERNAVRAPQRALAAAEGPARGVTAPVAADPRGAGQPAAERGTVGLATHPAGRRLAQGPAAWWLVDEDGGAALAGPFEDRVDAEWATVSGHLPETAKAVHGVRRADGSVARRPSPPEQSWLAELGRELDRLPEDWDPLMEDDEDGLTTLAVEVTAALLEAGLPLHDCAGAAPGEARPGGVCLTPHPAGLGVLVTWRQHDRMSVEQVRGAAMETAVQRTMTTAVGTLLRQLGFPIEQFGVTGCHLVTARPC